MKFLFSAICSIIFFCSCKKESSCPYAHPTIKATDNEIVALQNYLQSNNIQASQDASGIFFNITSPGQGNSPGMCSYLTLKYRGSNLLSGAVFDSTAAGSTTSFELGGLINGWKYGLPKIKPGGKINLFIPPSLGYGNTPVTGQNGAVIIPANSYLRFDVELIAVE